MLVGLLPAWGRPWSGWGVSRCVCVCSWCSQRCGWGVCDRAACTRRCSRAGVSTVWVCVAAGSSWCDAVVGLGWGGCRAGSCGCQVWRKGDSDARSCAADWYCRCDIAAGLRDGCWSPCGAGAGLCGTVAGLRCDPGVGLCSRVAGLCCGCWAGLCACVCGLGWRCATVASGAVRRCCLLSCSCSW